MIENLRQYEGETVWVMTKDGEEYIGWAGDYISPEDNKPVEIDAIILECCEAEVPIQFNNDEIEVIDLLENTRRVELSVHTCMSENDGINRVGDYINEALKDFMPAIAITDHNSVQSFTEAYNTLIRTKALEKDGIKLIYGTELHYKRDKKKYNISILARNNQGLKQLYKIISDATSEHRAIMTIEALNDIFAHRENLVLGINLMNELLDLICAGKTDSELEEFISDFDYVMLNPLGHYRYFIEDGVIENEEQLKEIYARVIEICDKTGVKAVASDDAHYVFEDDGEARKILLCVKGFERYKNQPKLHFRNTKEMLAEFSFLPEKVAKRIVIENTRFIADAIEDNFSPFPQDKILPELKNAETDIKEFSYIEAIGSIREIIANAITHRSYIQTNNVQVALYDNRLEVTSPGMLLNGVTIDKIRAGYSKVRNRAIANAFAYMRIIEEWGSGIARMFDEFAKYGLKEPELIDMDGDFRVNFYRNEKDVTEGRNVTNNDTKNVTVEKLKQHFTGKKLVRMIDIINIINENNKITVETISNKTGVTVRTIKRDIEKLKEYGIVERQGSNAAGCWKVLIENK